MPSPESHNGDVSVILHKESALYIPPEGLLREARQSGETFEKTAYRLSMGHSVLAHIDYALPTSGIDGAPTMTYLARPHKSELDDHKFLVPHFDVEDRLKTHPHLSETDRRLFELALAMVRS
jgi:hypothetical protein